MRLMLVTTRARARSNSLLSFRSRGTQAIDRMILRPSAAGEIDVLATWRPPGLTQPALTISVSLRGRAVAVPEQRPDDPIEDLPTPLL
jgi:hypothetical protein